MFKVDSSHISMLGIMEIQHKLIAILGRWQGVTFTDANNCTLRDSIEIINVNPEIQGFVSILQNVSCFNGCDGIAQLSSTGGVLQHNYFCEWSNILWKWS